MTKTTLLFPAILVFGLCIMACQKEKQDIGKTQTITSNNLARFGDEYDLSKGDHRISLDSAIAYTNRYHQKKEASGLRPGEYTTSYTISANGLAQLFAYAKSKGIIIEKVRCYIGIKMVAGTPQETLVYVGQDASGKEIYEPTTGAFTLTLNSYTDVDGNPCPPVCNLTSNILNTSK